VSLKSLYLNIITSVVRLQQYKVYMFLIRITTHHVDQIGTFTYEQLELWPLDGTHICIQMLYKARKLNFNTKIQLESMEQLIALS